jgi:hypothetical protein
MPRLVRAAALLLFAVTYSVSAAYEPRHRQPTEPFAGVLDEHPAIEYATRPPSDRVALLQRSIVHGTASLSYRQPAGYLPSLLDALEIPPESQLLVFSKTGLQRADTGPDNPRALFFNDSVVVGYVAGARFLEIAAHDPEQGVVFYTIDQLVTLPVTAAAAVDTNARPEHSRPDIRRGTNCLTCHVSGSTLDVPGMITRSNFTHDSGATIPQLGFHIVDHRTPLTQRWGGWFVTGDYDTPPYGGVGHMGSVTTTIHPTRGDVAATSNEVLLRWLDEDIDGRGYPSHESDIAALMVFDHQMRAINLLTRLNWEARVASYDGRTALSTDGLRELVDEFVDYLLFVGAAAPPARLTPRAGFAAAFTAAGPRDSRGRSLRDLDLEHRLLRYPCSYMVYSAAFDHLPREVRTAVYERLEATLTDGDMEPKYSHVSPDDRRAILEILRETKPDWPAPR